MYCWLCTNDLALVSHVSCTDLPTIISGNKVAFIEPFGKIWPGKFGRKFSIGPSHMHATLAPFNRICEFSTKLENYSHTLFRFPLRQSPTRLSETCYSIDMLHELIEALKEEAQYLLLFLHSVIEIQVFEISSSSKPKELLKIKICEHENISTQREAFRTDVQSACMLHSQQWYRADFHVESCDTACDQTERKRWLVVNTVGSQRPCDWSEADKLKVLPWAGCALELSEDQAMDLSDSDPSITGESRIFCFLPMPKETCSPLPVHVNGTFGLNDDRRTLKWPSGERRHDPTANWNMTIVNHLLPACYAQLILEAIKLGISHEQVYHAWPQIQTIRGTNWSGLIKPLLRIILQEEVFWSENASMKTLGSWVFLDIATFIPKGEELSSVVKRVLSYSGLKLVNIPDHVWDVIDDKEVNEVSPSLLRRTLRRHSGVYMCLPAEDKHELLLYCLSDEQYEDLNGLKLLPLANGVFHSFYSGYSAAQACYVCSDQHPHSLLPNLDDHIVDLSGIHEDLHTELLSVASSGKTQLQQLDAMSVSKLLPLCMPGIWKHLNVVSVSESDFPWQWFKIFWEWVQSHNLLLFTNQMVLPIVRRPFKEQHKMWVTKLVTKSKVLFISHSDNLASELLTGLEEIGLYFTGDSDHLFPYLQHVCRKLLSYNFVNSATPDGVLRAIVHACKGNMRSLQNIEFSDIQARELQFFINSRRLPIDEHVQVVLWLPIFKALNRKNLCSIESASRDSWNQRAVLECAGGFDISSYLLPPNLVVFSSYQNMTGLIYSYPSKVFAPTKTEFIQSVLIPIICSNTYPDDLLDDLMVEILQQMLTVRNITNRRDLCHKLSKLSFLHCCSTGGRKAPNELFDISKKELKDLFVGKPVFPQPPFTQTHLLTALRECGLRQSVEAQEIVDIILSISTEPTSSPRLSRAQAVLRYLDKNLNCLYQMIVYEGMWYSLNATLPLISRQNCWLPVSVNPPERYPDCLEWRGRACTSSLTTLSSSALICCEEDADALSFILGSQLFIVRCSSNLSKVFQNHVPLQQVGLHFQHVIANCQNIEEEILHYIVRQTYKHFSMNLHHGLRSILPTSWLWIRRHNIFVSSQKAALHPHPSLRQSLDPYLFTVPEDLREFSNLFIELGVVEHFTKSQALSVLATIKNERKHPQTSNRDSWTVVMGILTWLTTDGSVALGPGETLYVPIESESHTLRLEDSKTVCYADDQGLREFVDMVDEEYTLCHDRINHLAQSLSIAPLSQHLDISDDLFNDIGQHEPLEVRIRGILRDYTDGLTIIKELLQNADDAGATEVNLCFDARHHKTKPRIFPNMAKCYGPALIVHNNKVFTDEDFESITKLAGATKQNKPLKIGKFGVGFCSVYHITDVPSFVSREYFCIFDPLLHCLRGHVRDTSRPGKRIKFTRKCIKRSNLLAPYQGLYGFDFQEPFEGTIFRFPFRTSASILSSIMYTEHHIKRLINDIQKSSSKLLLFLQNVQHIIFSQFTEGDTSHHVLLEIHKHAFETLSVDTQLLKIECNAQQTRCTSHGEDWLVSSFTEKVEFLSQERDGTASVACQLQWSMSSKQYRVKEISGEVFCFLPLSLQSGLPVHVSANFAVLNDRTGIRSSDEYGTGANEAEWNVDLMKSIIPHAYLNLILCLSQMSNLEKDYSFYSLWPLKEKFMVHNPWDILIQPLYLHIAGERLLYSIYTRQWLTMDESKFLPSDILCLTPNSSIPDCVYKVVDSLCIPIIDLPSKYMAHLPRHKREACTIQKIEFVAKFFDGIEYIDVATRNTTLHILLRSLSIYPESQDFNRVLRKNCCIPCSPDGKQLKKCHEIIDTKAPFAPLYTPEEGMFPEKQFICSSTRPAMTSLGMITDRLPWDMLTERAGTIIKIRNKIEAMQRAKLVLNCIDDNLSQTSALSSHFSPESSQYCLELQSIKFLPVQPRPKHYPACLTWCGENSAFKLLSAEEIYIGESCAILAGSHICLLCAQEPELGGCGYVTRKVVSGLSIKTQPPLSAVIKHLHHIITVFISLRGRGKPQGISSEWLDGVCSKTYEFLEEEDVSGTELCTLPCIWTGSDFVHANAVALNCTYSGPYLFGVPNCLKGKSSLLRTFKIKKEFTINDIQLTLKQMKDDFRENSISERCRKLVPLLLADLTDMIEKTNTEDRQSLDLNVFLPDAYFIMQKASELAYNDAPWCNPTSDTPFVNNTIPREFAVKLGVQPVRSKYLEMYEDDYKGEEFGQHEELTRRIKNILRNYPLDITILKELLQNADDAKATKMYIILDKRTHGMHKLPSDEWKDLQGPALLVWNDSIFQEKDFEGIQELGLGSKRSEAETIGMYGIGFNAVYHLTDCPSFISTEESGKSTLCVLDPHCRYIPGAKDKRPGRRFNNLDEKFWAKWSDMRSAYLQSSILGLPEEMKIGSLFRFPLRREELFRKSELVDHDSHSRLVKNKPQIPISANLMQKHLRQWCPDLKQTLLFLNNVTELKVFEISDSPVSKNNNMQLTHWFKANIDDHAKENRTLFQQKVQRFENKSRPCLERYTLTLVEKGLKGNKDIAEKWFIQQGVGDVDNPEQEWHFLPHMKPKHGIAAPLCAPNKASEMRQKSQLFCFLPLQVFSNLPVHVNGSFVLDSSRRKLWQSNIPDELTKWNEQMLEAIASSYAEFLVQSQDLYIDPVDTTKKGLWNSIRQYYNSFPTWLGRNELFPPPKDKECLSLAKMVYHRLLTRNACILVHIKKEANGTQHIVEYLPLLDKDTPQNQAYFWDGKNNPDGLGSVLHRIGMRLTATPMRILHHLSEFKECILCKASGKAVFKYYAKFHGQVSPNNCFPQLISRTHFGSVDAFKLFTEHILLQVSEDEAGFTFPEDPFGFPLLLTEDNQLRNLLKEDKAIRSRFCSLFSQHAGEHFLYHQLMELKYVESYFLQPSEGNWDKICSILEMTLPKSLNVVMIKNASEHINLLKLLWKCLAQDRIFTIHLEDIVEMWALIPSTWGQRLSVFSIRSEVLPIMPPSEENSEKEVFDIIQRIGMPIFDINTADYDLCRPFCPTLSEPHLVLQSVYHLYCQGYIQSFLSSSQNPLFTANVLLKYFGTIHLSHEPESLKQVKSLPLFKEIGGKFCPITGTVYVWPGDVCKVGQKVWLRTSADTVFLEKNGNWTHLGNAETLHILCITVFDVYTDFIFPVFDQLTPEERFKHLQHIRDQLFKDAETYSESQCDDKKQAAETFIRSLRSLPCLPKHGVLQPLCKFFDPEEVIFTEFEEFNVFPPEEMQDENWLKFLRKIGLRTSVSQEEFLHLCRQVQEGRCLSIKNASTILLRKLFHEKEWYNDEDFLGKVSVIAFVVVQHLPRLSKIQACALGEKRVQKQKTTISLTSLCNAAEYKEKDVHLIWTVKPVVHLPSLPTTVQHRHQVRANLLHSLCVKEITAENVLTNIINISHTHFSNFSNFDRYPQHLREPKHHSLINVLMTNFKYLNDKCSKDSEALSQLSSIPCIPVCAEGKVEQITCPVLVKPLEVIAMEPEALKPFACFLNPLPQAFYSCLHHVLSTIGVQQKVTLKHVRGALEAIKHQTQKTLDVNTKKVVRNLIQVLQELLLSSHETLNDESDLGLSPLYLPNTEQHLVESTSLMYEDTRYFRNENFSFEGLPFSKFSLLTDKKDIRKEEQFCLALPKAIAPKPLSTLCSQEMSVNCEEVEPSSLVVSLQKTFCMPSLAAAVCALLRSRGDELSKMTQTSISQFFRNAKFVTVVKLPVNVYLKIVEPPAHIGTAEVDFHAQKQCDGSYVLSVVANSCVPRIYKSMAALILPVVVEMSGTDVNTSHKCEELLSQLLMANNAEDIMDIMSEYHIPLSNAEDLCQPTPFNPNIEPKLGSSIPESLHHRLQQDIDNIFRAGEWVGYEKADEVIVFAQIGYRVENEDNKSESFDKYLIYVEENDPYGQIASVVSIYKILRTLQKQPNSSDDGSLVVYDGNSDAAKLGSKFDTEELKRAKKKICDELRRIWKLPKDLRKRAIKRMYLKWHPDKHDNKAMAEEAFQFLLHQISLMEEEQASEELEEEGSVYSPVSTTWNSWYETWDRIAQRHRETGRQDQNEEGFSLLEPQPEPHNARVWITQAECDLEALTILKNGMQHTQRVCANVCFLAHEVAEKSLKAGMFAVCGLHPSDLKYHHLITNYARSLHHEKPRLTEGLIEHVAAVSDFYNRTRWPNQYTPHQVPAHHYYPNQAIEAEVHAKDIFKMMKDLVDHMASR